MKRLLKFVLAVIGFLAVLKYAVITLLGMTADEDDDVYTKAYPSPNGHYSAVLVSRSGGGAIAPFCSDEVVVIDSRMDLKDVLKSDGYRVYSGECDSFFEHAPSPNIQWDTDFDLRIDFAISGTRMFSRNVDLRGTDASGNVRIRFAAYR